MAKKNIRAEIKSQMAGYITAALGVVAGLAWNEAIKSTINLIFPSSNGNSLIAEYFYAVLVTVIVVILTVYILRLMKGEEEEK